MGVRVNWDGIRSVKRDRQTRWGAIALGVGVTMAAASCLQFAPRLVSDTAAMLRNQEPLLPELVTIYTRPFLSPRGFR
jgi:hypothetical protein